jgi:protein O-GlcNAc transferase
MLADLRESLHSFLEMKEWPVRLNDRNRRYLLIKAWGFGFWSDVSHVLGCLLLAEFTGRIPVTHWGVKSLYSDGTAIDAFQLYFQPVSAMTVEELAGKEASFFPSKWSSSNVLTDDTQMWCGNDAATFGICYLDRKETVAVVDHFLGVIDLLSAVPKGHRFYGKSVEAVYRDLATSYLRPTLRVMSEVDAIYKRQIAGSPTIAVHVRGSDKKCEMQDLERINGRYFEVLDREDPSWHILLLTDDARLTSAFCIRYGDRIILTDSQRTDSDIGIHYDRSLDPVRLGHEVMRDTYLALRCDKFVGNGRSNLSAMVELLKEWDEDTCCMLVPSQLLNERNLSMCARNRESIPGT